MAKTMANVNLTPKEWDRDSFKEYVRKNRFKRYFGKDENSIIQVKFDLTKKKGDTIVVNLVNELSQDGVEGSEKLEGNEERIGTRSMEIKVGHFRHGVVVDDLNEQISAISLRNLAKPRLMIWSMKKMRNDIINALGSVDGVYYSTAYPIKAGKTVATTAQKNTWHDNNSDRVLYGKDKANHVAGDHAASLANVDSTNDKMSATIVSKAKRMAADAGIRPVVVKDDEEWYVMFLHKWAFRDLKADATIQAAQKDALPRSKDNPIFAGGDIVYDGVICREIKEFPTLAGAGATGIDVAVNFLCGAQALAVCWAKKLKSVTQKTDYEFDNGVAISEMRGIEKLRFGTGDNDTDVPKDHGVLTIFASGVADA